MKKYLYIIIAGAVLTAPSCTKELKNEIDDLKSRLEQAESELNKAEFKINCPEIVYVGSELEGERLRTTSVPYTVEGGENVKVYAQIIGNIEYYHNNEIKVEPADDNGGNLIIEQECNSYLSAYSHYEDGEFIYEFSGMEILLTAVNGDGRVATSTIIVPQETWYIGYDFYNDNNRIDIAKEKGSVDFRIAQEFYVDGYDKELNPGITYSFADVIEIKIENKGTATFMSVNPVTAEDPKTTIDEYGSTWRHEFKSTLNWTANTSGAERRNDFCILKISESTSHTFSAAYWTMLHYYQAK